MNERDPDEIYRRAAASDPVRPSREVRQAILVHAAQVAAATRPRSFRGRAIQWLAHLRASSQRRSWQILAPLAAAAVAVVMLVPLWRSPRPLDTTSISDQKSPVIAPGAPTPAAAPPPLAERRPQPSLAVPAASMPAPAPSPAAAPSSPLAADVAPSTLAASNARAQSAASGASVASWRQQIQRAALFGDAAGLERLLKVHPELIDVRDELGRTPLMLATLGGQTASVTLLLAHGANPNTPDSAGRTPLDVARAQDETAITAELMRSH
jgi:hypothetical protein